MIFQLHLLFLWNPVSPHLVDRMQNVLLEGKALLVLAWLDTSELLRTADLSAPLIQSVRQREPVSINAVETRVLVPVALMLAVQWTTILLSAIVNPHLLATRFRDATQHQVESQHSHLLIACCMRWLETKELLNIYIQISNNIFRYKQNF